MTERPLNERPAARPIHKEVESVSPSQEAVYVAPPPFWKNLGCLGWSFATITLLGVSAVIGGFIQAANGEFQTSHGSETYSVSPVTVDPRSTQEVSAACAAGMAASAADATENGERLLKETGNLCNDRDEWEAALYRYPRAIGVVDGAYLDGSEFGMLCHSYPQVKICAGFKE